MTKPRKTRTRTTGRQAIATKFLPCTNHRPSRVKATAEAGSVTLSWDHGLNANENHELACRTLANNWGWGGNWAGGAVASGGYVFVDVSR